jgi:hypothetical protein
MLSLKHLMGQNLFKISTTFVPIKEAYGSYNNPNYGNEKLTQSLILDPPPIPEGNPNFVAINPPKKRIQKKWGPLFPFFPQIFSPIFLEKFGGFLGPFRGNPPHPSNKKGPPKTTFFLYFPPPPLQKRGERVCALFRKNPKLFWERGGGVLVFFSPL